ncbi:MAG: response regulator [Candidatus Omnitrophica bacterium]|nr:response regulator [Candidatus Omnitrophota bacterium]
MRQLKILIVDDEEGIVELLQRIYSARGFVVFGATDGIKAVEIFEKERPEVIFIDVHMPFSPIDGIETLERIKAIDKDAPCIMLTRIYDEESIKRAKKAGALHYVTKPFELEDLDRCIEEIKEKLKG